MSLSYAAHINGDKVYDIATGYWIEAKQEAAASAGRIQWNVYLYDDEGTFVEKYAGGNFPEADKDKYLFAGFDMNLRNSDAAWRIFVQTLPSYSVSQSGSGTSSTLKQYFSGEQGYAINADYAVIDVQPLAVSDNGTYTAPFSKAYSPVTVDVQEQPWQPLEDGYSNFWFELTNDTLSPWLNFNAKTEDAVIDWGDGSGEVTLDTLTPTHTYAKAGKYIVKVKGVTGIDQQYVRPLDKYSTALKYVELNSDAVSILQNGFMSCAQLRNIVCHNSGTTFGANTFNFCPNLVNCEVSGTNTTLYGGVFSYCLNLLEVTLDSGIRTVGSYAFNYCMLLQQVTVPSTVTTINTGAFTYCISLRTVHMQPTTPPTLGTSVFSGLPSDWICYVPQGTGETYKSASGWSAYADHILEEGQTPNRAMLSRLAKAVETDTDKDMR